MALPTLLLTRPQSSAQAFANSLSADALAAVELMIAPVMEISSTGAQVNLDGVRGVIFTSANGVLYAPDGQDRVAFCVGAQTTQTAKERGWRAQQLGDTARQLVDQLLVMRPDAPIIHLGGIHTRGDIAQNLTAAGIETRHIALYSQTLSKLEAKALNALRGPCIIPVFSPRSAEQLVREAGGQLDQAHIVALSESVAAPFRGEKTASMFILDKPQSGYMHKAVENLCLTVTLP